jgi:hypothetical protein
MSIDAYEDAVRKILRHTEASPAGKEVLQRELIRYACERGLS